MKVKSESGVAQLCPTPSDPMDCSLLGFSIHGIFQARVLEWGAIAFSRGRAENNLIAPVRMKQLSQSGNGAQLWMCLVVKVKPDAVKNNIPQKPGMLGP